MIPAPVSLAGILRSPRFRAQLELVRQPGAQASDYACVVDTVLGLIAGTHRTSADVVVGRDDAHARELAAGYAPWVHSIRTGVGAIPFPDAGGASAYDWDPDLVADRLETQIVGDAAAVVGRLRALRDLTGADELLVTTITHDHADRVGSYRLLAEAW